MKLVRYFRTMTKAVVRCSLLAVLFVPCLGVAQDMILAGGTMTVEGGTRVILSGPINWTIAPSATLINDGRIELGDQGTVIESVGTPIIGIGTEHALYNSIGPVLGVEPGGLGLSLSIGEALGNMELVRGHSVQMEGSGTESVARYFQLLCNPMIGASIDIGFRFDPTELNGLVGSELILHSADELSGPWTAMTGAVDVPAHLVTTTWSSPWSFVTAFDEDITTDAPDLDAAADFLVWPSVSADVVHVRSNDARLSKVSLIDMTGRTTGSFAPQVTDGTFTFSIAGLSPGVYMLWLNNQQAFRIVRP